MAKPVSLSLYRYYNRSGVTTTVPGPDGKPVTVRNGEYVTGEWFARFASFKGPTVRKPLVAELPPGIVEDELVEKAGNGGFGGVNVDVEVDGVGSSEVGVVSDVIGDVGGDLGERREEQVEEQIVEVGMERLEFDMERIRQLLRERGEDREVDSVEVDDHWVKVMVKGDDYYICSYCGVVLKSLFGVRKHVGKRHGVSL